MNTSKGVLIWKYPKENVSEHLSQIWRKDGQIQRCASMEICKGKYVRALVTNMKECEWWERGKGRTWREGQISAISNLYYFLESAKVNFTLSLWKFYLFFAFDKKICRPKFSRGKRGTWRKWPFQTWLCQNLVLDSFQAFKFSRNTY